MPGAAQLTSYKGKRGKEQAGPLTQKPLFLCMAHFPQSSVSLTPLGVTPSFPGNPGVLASLPYSSHLSGNLL